MTESGRRVVGAASLLAASVLAARLLGFVRDALFASQVGSGPAADAYFAAFLIPDILGYLLAAGAAAVAVTPPYLARLNKHGLEAAGRFAGVVVGTVGLIATLLTILLWYAAEPLLRFQFAGFDEATLAETLRLMRIVLPAQIFFLTGGVLRGVLMAHGQFAPQALASVVYSAAPILGGLIFMFAGQGGADGFAWGTLAGAAIGQWWVPVLALRRVPGAVGPIRVHLGDTDFREYLWLAIPLMLGLGLATVDEWYEKWIGAAIAPGAIAAITYARKLMMAPVGVVGQAVGAALLPSLTTLFQERDQNGFGTLLTDTLRMTLGLGVLAGGALFALALPAVRVLYERGKFLPGDSTEVAALLMLLAFAVPGWVVQQVAVRGFYARGEMWRAMGLSTAVALAVFPLYLLGGRTSGVQGLALASATAISLNAVITLIWLRKRSGAPGLGALAETALRSVAVAGAGVLAARGFLGFVGPFHALGPVPPAWISLATGAVVYGSVSLLAIQLFGDPPIRAGVSRIAARLRLKRPSDN